MNIHSTSSLFFLFIFTLLSTFFYKYFKNQVKYEKKNSIVFKKLFLFFEI